MNAVTEIVFAICWFILLAYAIRLMVGGWSAYADVTKPLPKTQFPLGSSNAAEDVFPLLNSYPFY